MELFLLWCVGWGFVVGAVEEDLPWWVSIGVFFVWPVILGDQWGQSIRRKDKEGD